jgi:hypothetical protein
METSDPSRVTALAHRSSDVDLERGSLHHTLGKGPTQASPGNHTHIGSVVTYNTTPPVGTLALNGATINYADYPDYFRFLGLGVGTTYVLPTHAKLAVVVR